MIKLIIMLRRKEGMTHEAFCDYWLHKHGPLVASYASVLKVRRYVQSHVTPPKEGEGGHQGSSGESWDGVTEVWLDGPEVLAESRMSEDIQKVQAILHEDELNFVDSARSKMLVTVEHDLI